ncbi:MAG TPA: M20/M25/M40 family metallo-hydrolase [Gemmatimonadales bacterium]|nr:M20/M25/M40 family metallo-hydrolase [Gemmatimonadales bacterium]
MSSTLLGCGGPSAPPPVRPSALPPIALIAALADDSMQGRRTATPGALRAARYLAGRMQAYGLEPAGDSAYFQRVPFVVSAGPEGERLRLGRPAPDSLGGVMALGVNVIGLVRGSDPALAKEAVVVGAHYDHLGIGRPVNGDSIYNGADDDASGVAAVLTAARELAAGPKPRRTVVFLLSTGEEEGVLGTQYYLEHPAWPLEHTVADLEVEMIGRPDSLAGGPGRLWLTGYERSTMGETFAAAGLPVVADPRPDQSFFLRSDNIVFAVRGIPAHTLSSYNMHRDYHQPSDEVSAVDSTHLARAAEVVGRAVRLLADGDPPRWHPGGQPTSLGR